MIIGSCSTPTGLMISEDFQSNVPLKRIAPKFRIKETWCGGLCCAARSKRRVICLHATLGSKESETLERRYYNILIFIVISISVLLLCQAIGLWVNNTIPQNTTLELSRYLHFTHLRNFGGVFGLAQGSGWLFGLISIGLLVGVSTYLVVNPTLERYEYICFGFVVGGGASNITDRLVYGSVIDFIDLQQIPLWHYVFNTADVMIHLGVWPLLIIGFVLNKTATDRETAGS